MSTFLTCSLWGLLYMFMTGYFFLHSWLNMYAELFRFADREFYSVRINYLITATIEHYLETIFIY